MDLGRTESIDTLVRHREAVVQRLSSSLRQAEQVDAALAELDQQLANLGEVSVAPALRASTRALLAVASGQQGYDATLVPDGSGLGVRVRNTLFGLQADVVQPAPARPSQGQDVEPPPQERTAVKGSSEHREPPEGPRLEPDGVDGGAVPE
jgi:hypothetical protein